MTSPKRQSAVHGAGSDAADRQILELTHRHRALDAQVEESRRRLAATREAVATIVGIGEGARGAVRAAVDAHNHLLDLVVEPQALRLGSIEALRTALIDAVRNAEADAALKLARATGPVPTADPVRAYEARIPEVDEMLRGEQSNPWGL